MKYKLYLTEYDIFWNNISDNKPSEHVLISLINKTNMWKDISNVSINYESWNTATIAIDANIHPKYIRLETYDEADVLYTTRFYFINSVIKETSKVIVYQLILDYYSSFFYEWVLKNNNKKVLVERGTYDYRYYTNPVKRKYLFTYDDPLINIVKNTNTNLVKYYVNDRKITPSRNDLNNYQTRLYLYVTFNNINRLLDKNYHFKNPLSIVNNPINWDDNCLYYVIKFADSEKLFCFPLFSIYGNNYMSFGNKLDIIDPNVINTPYINGEIKNTYSGLKKIIETLPNQFVGICAGINPFLMWNHFSVFSLDNDKGEFSNTYLVLVLTPNGIPVGEIVNLIPKFPVIKNDYITKGYGTDFLYEKYTKIVWGTNTYGINPRYIRDTDLFNEDAYLTFSNGFKIMDSRNIFSNDGFLFDFGVPINNSITTYSKYLEQQKIVWDMGLKSLFIDFIGGMFGIGISNFKAAAGGSLDGVSGTAIGAGADLISHFGKSGLNLIKFAFQKEADKSLAKLKLSGKTIDIDTTSSNYMLSLNEEFVFPNKTYLCSYIDYSPMNFNSIVYFTNYHGIVINNMVLISHLQNTTPFWYIKLDLAYLIFNYKGNEFKQVGHQNAIEILKEFANGYRIWDQVIIDDTFKKIDIDTTLLCDFK